ncbi:HEPN domain-containing protein [Flavihumibacter sp. UBA7668]|uniref:HEPN domain-containing protein n=1 Tax=Flavihumibacter sp. UBA7668 TaxID=1946542 RepID=UPI0025B82BB6|nr:HEPN domain-containing protein [Flavihumibacter sp. UBA7668]
MLNRSGIKYPPGKVFYSNTEFHTCKEWCNFISTGKLKRMNCEAPIESISQSGSLQAIIHLLVISIVPSKIFMMEHSSIPNEITGPYRELLVVLPSSGNHKFTLMEPIMELFHHKNRQLSISLYAECKVMEGLRNGEWFYSLYFTEDNLIYDDFSTTYPLPDKAQSLEMKNNLLTCFNESIKKAKEFLEMAITLYKQSVSPLCVFFLHQSVELCFRSVIQYLGGYEKRTHNLGILKKQLLRVAPEMNNCFQVETEEEKSGMEILENAYLKARYDDSYEVPVLQLPLLIKEVNHTLVTACQTMNKKLVG